MPENIISVTEGDWKLINRALFTDDGCENAAVLVCGISDTDVKTDLLVRGFITVPNEEYEIRHAQQLRVSPQFYNRVIDLCAEQRLHPVLIHSHRFGGEAWYSLADDFGESRLLPVLESLLPSANPASLVVTETDVTGRRLVNGEFERLNGLRVLGPRISQINFGQIPGRDLSQRFDRQVRAFGQEGQSTIQNLRIGIVGVGGIGSIVLEQLVRLGVEDFVLADNDLVEESNLTRLMGANVGDLGKPKVEVLKEHLTRLGAKSVSTLNDSAIRQDVLLNLRGRDLIFSCVDNDRTRAVLNRFSYQYFVPLIDVGTRMDARGGNIAAAAGRVSVVGNGLTCLRCSHHLNAERIRAESLPDTERRALQQEGYVIGIDEPAPAVMPINTVIAGLGVTAGINLFVNLTGNVQPVGQIYDATSGSVFTTDQVHESGCDVCDELKGVKGLGDLQIVSAY